LVVSTNTIKSHVRAVLLKFDVHSRSELRLLLADFNFDNWNNLLS
jgi:DNA-binding CsgD family transcriptional regulator